MVTAETSYRVAHLLRPAQGGMREQVRILLINDPNAPLLLAPVETLETLSDAVPDTARHPLRTESIAPHHQIAAGQIAGRWAKRNGAALLHGHGLRYAPLFAAASLTSGLPLAITLHNLIPSDLSPMQRAAVRAALSRASVVIAISDAVAKSVAALVPDIARIVTIRNGIDLSRFMIPEDRKAERRQAMRAALQIADDTALVLCLSRLSPEKDVANVLEAAAIAFPRLPPARLLIAGEGRLRKTLEMQIALLGLEERATLLGARSRDTIPDLLFAADLFALGSQEEGLSLAVLEAAAAGVPVVATDIGGLPEAVANGKTGLLVPPRDPGAFARALVTLISDPATRSAFGRAGIAHAQARFAQETMITATHAVYRRIIGR